MRAEQDAQQLNAFVDGELDLPGQLEVEARLRDDAALQAQLVSLRGLRAAVGESAQYHAAPDVLRAAVQAQLRAAAPRAVDRHPVAYARAGLARWFAWRPLLVSCALLVSLLGATRLLQPNEGRADRLAQEVVASHVRATLSQRLVDVASADQHTVKPWLSSKLDFSPPVRDLQLPGSLTLGARIDYLDGRPVATMVYRQGQHLVNHFVWPTSAQDSSVSTATLRGFRLAHWTRRGMEHWLISDLGAETFGAVVNQLVRPEAAP